MERDREGGRETESTPRDCSSVPHIDQIHKTGVKMLNSPRERNSPPPGTGSVAEAWLIQGRRKVACIARLSAASQRSPRRLGNSAEGPVTELDLQEVRRGRCHTRAPTAAGGQGLVPGRLPVRSDHARDGRRVHDFVAGVTLVGHGGAQLEVRPDSGPVHYVPRVKAGFPGLLCRRNGGDPVGAGDPREGR